MIKSIHRNGFIIVEQTAWYVYNNKKDMDADKWLMISSDKNTALKATKKMMKK